MKSLSFPPLLLAIILPAVLYAASVEVLERRLQANYQQEIESTYLGDVQALLDGAVPLKEAVGENIDAFLHGRRLLNWGVRVGVTVATEKGTLLYPAIYEPEPRPEMGLDRIRTAAENFALLSEIPRVEVDVRVPHGAPVSLGLLAGFVLLSGAGLFVYYRRGVARAALEETRAKEEIARLSSREQEFQRRLKALDAERRQLSGEIHRLKTAVTEEKERAGKTEEEMLAELISMEEAVRENQGLQKHLESEIETLREQIAAFEKENRQKARQKEKAAAGIDKRFAALYKNLEIHERALDGFLELTEEMKIKAEEVIHQLNDDPDTVTVKRKVFGKKNRETVFEVLFGYKGRLYFRKLTGNRAEVLAVGTKNTQQKDLKFLDQL
ncbi:MAG: hypothetical protein JRI83_14125 [Deltaproteobacteria bacterium]|nr:hypothetical protein [Deltaproteobacteria bacterium]